MFDDIIRGKANEHEALVPPGAWDNIAKKKKKRHFIIFWWAAGIMLLAAFSVGGYYLINNDAAGNKKNTIAKKPATQNLNAAENKLSVKSSGQTIVAVEDENKKATGSPDIANKEDKEQVVAISQTGRSGNTDKSNLSSKSKTSKANEAGNAPINRNEDKAVGNKPLLTINKKIKRGSKGKLNVKQTNPGIDESPATNGIVKAMPATEFGNPLPDGHPEEGTSNKRETEPVIPGTADKKDTTLEQERKINKAGAPQKQEQPQKENTAAVKQKRKKHWFIEAAAIPLIASSSYNKNIPFSRTLVANNSMSVYKANLVSASIEPAVAFSFLLRWQVSKKTDIGTGLQYMLLKENIHIEGKETQTNYSYVDRLVNGRLVPDTVATLTEGTRAINAVNSYQLFSIPLFVQCRIIDKKQWSLGAVGGIYFNISSNYKNEINRNAAAPLLGAPGTRDKGSTGIDIFAGLRIAKKLNKHFDFFAMPSVRLSLATYYTKNSLLDKNINQAGVGFGVSYKIN